MLNIDEAIKKGCLQLKRERKGESEEGKKRGRRGGADHWTAGTNQKGEVRTCRGSVRVQLCELCSIF